jgi:AraC-like DNA-binding protein
VVRSDALTVVLNFQGEGLIAWANGSRLIMRPGSMHWLRGSPTEPCMAHRLAGRERHECLVLHFPDAWIISTLRATQTAMPADLKPLVTRPFAAPGNASRPLSPDDKTWALVAMAPHLCEEARRLMDTARLTEFFLRQLFEQPRHEEFCTRTKRQSRERIERAKAAMLQRLDEPPSLEELAVIAHCNPHYLSRTFTQIEGLTLSLWLRRARIERAADMIASGQCNVSEAALEVGYRSFSHFSRAFFEEKGVQPSRWAEHLASGTSPSAPPSNS